MHEAGDNTMRVLVAEDEEILAELVATGLRRAGFAVDTVYSGDAALAYLGLHDYDVVVLDRDLPRVHGDDVARRLVSSGSRTRILMLTASGTMEDRVEGLDLGADDYVSKPFEFPELVSWCARCAGAAPVPCRPSWNGTASGSTACGGPRRGTGATSTCPRRSSRCCSCCWRPTGGRSAPRSCWSGPGTRTPTRSRGPCASA